MLDLSVFIDEVRPSPDEQSCHCSVKQDGQLKRQRQTITYAPGGCCSPGDPVRLRSSSRLSVYQSDTRLVRHEASLRGLGEEYEIMALISQS